MKFFAKKDFGLKEQYDKGFKVSDFFSKYSAGIKTKVDHIAIDFNKEILKSRVENILEESI